MEAVDCETYFFRIEKYFWYCLAAGLFDRLLRSEQEWEEKRLYMLDNPVRAGLCQAVEEWKYKGDLDMFVDER